MRMKRFYLILAAEISMVKKLRDQNGTLLATSHGEDVFRQMYLQHQNFLQTSHLIDFDDMLVYCKELFEQRKDILAGWQKRYPYILIDEFQDINQVQYEICKDAGWEKRTESVSGGG